MKQLEGGREDQYLHAYNIYIGFGLRLNAAAIEAQ